MNNKYITVLFVMMLGLSLSMACLEDLGYDDDQIIFRIEAMETALNDNDFINFKACFDVDCYLYLTFTVGDLNDYHTLGTYNFHDYNITVSDNMAYVSCIATVTDTGPLDFDTTFSMVKTNGVWYIKTWNEEGDPMFYRQITAL